MMRDPEKKNVNGNMCNKCNIRIAVAGGSDAADGVIRPSGNADPAVTTRRRGRAEFSLRV